MRIGMLISGSLDSLTGGYIYDRKLIEHLKEVGNRVDLIQLPDWDYSARLANSLQLCLSKKLNNLRVDVLLQDELDHPALFLLNRRLKSRTGPPVISIVHHLRSSEARPAWQNHIFRQVEKSYLAGVDGFIFNSLTTSRTVEDLIGQTYPHIVAYPCGNIFAPAMTAEQIMHRAERPGPLKVLFVGNLIQRKGLHVLLKALAGIPENSCHVTVVGNLSADIHYVNKIRAKVKEDALAHRVHFTDSVPDELLSAAFSDHHVLCVPSSYEGFGMVYLEGMSFGLPAIASTSGAAGEIITHGRNGFLVRPDDHVALAQHLIHLNDNRQKLINLGIGARLTYERHPAWKNTCENVAAFLHTLLKN